MPLLRRFLQTTAVLLGAAGTVALADNLLYNASGQLTQVTTTGSVGTPPTIVGQPVSAALENGQPFALAVNATGPALTYQWYKDTQLISGATSASLVFPSVSAATLGSYTVTVTNGAGSRTSDPAVLSFPPNAFTIPLGGTGEGWQTSGNTLWYVIEEPARQRVSGNPAVGTGRAFEDDSYLEGSVTVTQPTTVRYWMKLPDSAEAAAEPGMLPCQVDILINDRMLFSTYLTGSIVGWQQYQMHLPAAGTYSLRWRHLYNGYVLLDDLTLTNAPDTDGDGMSDDWEMEFFATLDTLPGDDYDNDTNNNLVEYRDRTHPKDASASLSHVFEIIHGNGVLQRSLPEQPDGYPFGTTLNFTPVPDAGNLFVGWQLAYSQRTNVQQLSLQTYSQSSRTIELFFEPERSLAEGADTTGLTWTTGGDVPWITQSTQGTSDGVDALMTAPMAATLSDQVRTSWVQTTITGPAKLSFDYKSPTAVLVMTVDGMHIGQYYASSWDTKEVYLPSGTHVVRWTSAQPYISEYAFNAAFLDKVAVTPLVDSDNDGMADAWELQYFSDLSRDGSLDYDSDGVSDLVEFQDMSAPVNSGEYRVRLVLSTVGGGSISVSPQLASYVTADAPVITAVPDAGRTLQAWENPNYYFKTNPFTPYLNQPQLALTARFMPAADLPQALDNSTSPLVNGLPGWVLDTTTSHDGVDAAVTPTNLHNYEEGDIKATITGPKMLSFWWRMDRHPDDSSELKFRADSSPDIIYQPGGNVWQQVLLQLGPGEHSLRWWFRPMEYYGTSKAWLDEVIIADDSDEDGLPDDWETAHFGSLAATTGTGDSDGDGNSNQQEWADKSDPNSASSAQYRLAIASAEPASVQVSPLLPTYGVGASVTLMADPAFVSWSGDASGSTNPLPVTMNGNKTISPVFQPLSRGVDCTKLLFQTSPTHPWVLDDSPNAAFYAGGDITITDRQLPANAQSWIETTFPTSGRLTFTVNSSFDNGSGGAFRWQLDGGDTGSLQYGYGLTTASVLVGPGTHTLRWIFDRGTSAEYDGYVGLDNLVWEPIPMTTLDEALELPGSTWTYGSSTLPTWLGLPTTTHDGVDAAESQPVANNGSAEMATTINVAATTVLSFWWKVSSEETYDLLTFHHDDVEVQSISGEQDWQAVSVVLGPGTHTLRWVYSKDGSSTAGEDRGWVDQISLIPLQTVPLVDALDKPGLTWTTSSSFPWAGSNAGSHDGVDGAFSGTITDGQTTWIETQITGPGELSFWWKMSGAWWDATTFRVNGTPATTQLSGETDWRQVTVTLAAGTNTLRWAYSRDPTPDDPVGEDKAWLDEVTFTSTAPGFNSWASGFGYSGADAQPTANPMRDGISNLLKYAFNLSPNASVQGAARHVTPGTGSSGLPTTTTTGAAGSKRLRLEYVRRRNATDIIYTVQFGSGLNAGDWSAATGTETVTAIDANWERVVIEDTVTSGTSSRRFGRVVVQQSP